MFKRPQILSDSEILFPNRYSKEVYNSQKFLETFHTMNRNFPAGKMFTKCKINILIKD